MNIIDNLQLHPRPPISLHKKQAESLTEKVTFLQDFLEDYNPHLGYSTEADPLESRIADAAYAAEDVIESHIVDQITSDGEKISSDAMYEALEKVIEEMALIQKEAMEIEGSLGIQHQLHTSDSLRSSSILQKSSMVGVDDVLYDLKDKLTSHCRDLQIIPIVGMGGTGKTTLATTIYQDGLIKEHFDICAWATISQDYSIREILIEVLCQLNEDAGHDLSESLLGEMLHKHLYGRKYLVILDDIWGIEAWDDIRRFFPDNENGSRIVITTRLSNLAPKLTSSKSIEMCLLDEAHSWDLLSITIFGGKGHCPVELEEIGKKIGKSCKGLPLSIVVVGGFLAKSEHTREYWKHIEENLNSIVNLEDDARCLKILHMSYKQLPIYLKSCFLYMGVFREDEVICVSKLIKLWVAEGFLKLVSRKTLEETAREYLKDLIDRNLILVHELGSIGNIKYCKIHDLMRDLCLREAKKERFYTVISKTSIPQGLVNAQRRIVISSTLSENEAFNALSSVPLVRCLMLDHESHELPPLNLRLLRILDSCRFLPIASEKFLENMNQLVNSRFIDIVIWALSSEHKFPSSIWLFWNLQTLIVDGFMESTAPTDIWYMPHIRHVEYPRLRLTDPPDGQDDIVLGNLQTLVGIKDFKCNQQVVKRIPNIKKLRISYTELDSRYCLSNLECFDKLESLTLSCSFRQEMNPSGSDSLRRLVSFPHSLKKLTLLLEESKCWEDILDKIGALPLLQKLTLKWGRFRGRRWETSEGQFCSLKFLALRECNGLHVWTTESSHFPCLDHLLLYGVDELEEIPLDFAEIATLRVMEVRFCSTFAAVSAKRILEEQEELYGEAALQVQVRLRMKDEALQSLASPNFHVTW